MGPAGDSDENDNDIDPDCQTDWLPLGAPATNFSNLPKTPGPIPTNKNFTPNFPAYPSGHATFGATAFHITRLFYGADGVDKGGVEAGHTGPDTLFQGLRFVSDELDGVNKDNKGTVRPRHVRAFPGGLWQMIEENGRSRVYLGVHWVFDAFTLDENENPDTAQEIGGVPLGLTIAEGIFNDDGKKRMEMSDVPPRS